MASPLLRAAVALAVAFAAGGAAAARDGAWAVSASRLRAGARALAAERARMYAGGAPSCEGLVEKMCKPCPSGGPADFCTKTKGECGALFCSPMCIRNTWTCSVTFGGDFKEEAKGAEKYSNALCGEFIAQGCSKIVKCCPDDDELFDFVENDMFLDDVTQPLMPSPTCTGGPSKELCSKCEGAVKVALEKAECPFPSLEGGDGTRDPKATGLASTASGAELPGVNAHKDVQDRCLKLEEKITAAMPGMKSTFQDNVCKCMGCCDGECFFPVTEGYKPGGLEDEPDPPAS